MASTSTSWEVVGKGKKTKSQIPHLSKQEKKKMVENMPRIEAQRRLTDSCITNHTPKILTFLTLYLPVLSPVINQCNNIY